MGGSHHQGTHRGAQDPMAWDAPRFQLLICGVVGFLFGLVLFCSFRFFVLFSHLKELWVQFWFFSLIWGDFIIPGAKKHQFGHLERDRGVSPKESRLTWVTFSPPRLVMLVAGK